MSRRKPLAALAAVTCALALAVPVASANAAPRAPATHSTYVAGARLVPGSLPCVLLVRQIQGALLFRQTALASFFSNVFVYSGCGGAAI